MKGRGLCRSAARPVSRKIPPASVRSTEASRPELRPTLMNERASMRIPVLDPLRGIAALAVTWFHFTNGRPGYLPSGLLKSSGSFGWLGVEVFFVISGFVIPYALWGAGYRIERLGRFMLK